jgi:hypothetical protein
MLSFAGLDEIRFSSGKPHGPDPCVVRLEAAIAMAHENASYGCDPAGRCQLVVDCPRNDVRAVGGRLCARHRSVGTLGDISRG